MFVSSPGKATPTALAGCLHVQYAILDGEIVHLDTNVKPQFSSLVGVQGRNCEFFTLRINSQ